MTNREIGIRLGALIVEERQRTNEILNLINMALDHRAYLELGFSSMFDWLVRGFGYSNAAAYRRIEAAKLLRAVPAISEKLAAGKVNLSSVAKAQSLIKAREVTCEIAPEMKAQIVERIEGKSVEETERILISIFPEAAAAHPKDRRVVLDERSTRHSMNFSKEVSDDLARAKEVLSHVLPNASDADIVGYALKFLLDRKDVLRRPTSAAEAIRVKKASFHTTKAATRRMVLKGSGAKCSYVDSVTGQVCGSTYQIQIDHIQARALGGNDDIKNLRPLCRQHNLLMAERTFGKDNIERFRRKTGFISADDVLK